MPLLGKTNYSQGRSIIRKSGVIRVAPTKRQSAASKIQRAWRRKKRYQRPAPPRFGRSMPKSLGNSVMREVSELKIRSLANRYLDSPLAQEVGAGATPVVYYQGYCLGSAAPTWVGPTGTTTSGFKELLGYQYPNGTGPDQRVGKYMYLKQATVNLRINMNSTARTACPMKFRVVVFKAIRNAQVGQTGGNPFDRLFVGNNGNEIGLNTSYTPESVGFELMSAITNKKNFTIYKDTCFILQNPFTSVQGSQSIVSPMSQSYPCEKVLNFTLRHNQKTAFDSQNQPSDCNYQYCMLVMSTPAGTANDSGNQDWRTSVRGTVSAYDN